MDKYAGYTLERAFKGGSELEHIMEGLALDIEFAIDKENRIILFQMLPSCGKLQTRQQL